MMFYDVLIIHDDVVISNGFKIVFLLSIFLNCMLLAVIGKYDGLKNPLRMLLLNLASVDLVATTLGKIYFQFVI